MSFYEDATIADLSVVLEVVSLSASPATMGARFASQTNDPDLRQVLQDLGADAGGQELAGWMQFGVDFKALLEAVQGIEDSEQTSVGFQTTDDGVNLLVSIGGTVIELP